MSKYRSLKQIEDELRFLDLKKEIDKELLKMRLKETASHFSLSSILKHAVGPALLGILAKVVIQKIVKR